MLEIKETYKEVVFSLFCFEDFIYILGFRPFNLLWMGVNQIELS